MRALLLFLCLCALASADPLSFVWRFGQPPSHPPLSDGKRFFVVADRQLWAGSEASGEVLWKRNVGYRTDPPRLVQDILLVRDSESLCALSPADGTVLWKHEERDFACDGRSLWVGGSKIQQLDPSTGQVLQTLDLPGHPLPNAYPYLIFHDDTQVFRLDPATARPLWKRPGYAEMQGRRLWILGRTYDPATGAPEKKRPQATSPTSLPGPSGWSLHSNGNLYHQGRPKGRLSFPLRSPFPMVAAGHLGLVGPNLIKWNPSDEKCRVIMLAQTRLESLYLPELVTPGKQTLYFAGENLGKVQIQLQQDGQTRWSKTFSQPEQGPGSGSLDLNFPQPGRYQIIAQAGSQQKKASLSVSRLGSICKFSPDQVEVFVYDFVSARPACGIQVQLQGQSQLSNAQGLAHFDLPSPLQPETPLKVGSLVQTLTPENLGGTGQLYLRTDRPLYRPGHKVEFFALCLNRKQLAPGHKIQVELRDPSDNLLQTLDLTSDDKGLISGSFLLSEEAPLGRYRLVSSCAQLQANQSLPLEVQAYKKPPFELKLSTAQPLYLQGQSVPVKISSQYFFGGPVAGAKIKLKATSAALYDDPDPAPDYESDPEQAGYYASTVWQGEVETDAQGQALVQVPGLKSQSDEIYTLTASAVGGEGQPVEARTSFITTVARFGIYVQPLGWVHEQGKLIPIRVHTLDRSGKPFSVPFRLQIGKSILSGHTDDRGLALCQVPARQSGYLKVSASTRDSGGRPVSHHSSLWVSGKDNYGSFNDRLDLIAGRRSLPPGGKLDLLILASQPSKASPKHLWLTVEGSRILWQKVLTLNKTATRVSIPIDRSWEGTLQVRALMPGYESESSASVRLKVTGKPGLLALQAEPDRKDYRPGKTATLKIQTDRPSALILSLVDDALYKLRGEFAPNLYEALHASPHQVEQVSLLPRQGRAAGFQTVEPPVQVRSQFQDTAYWKVGLLTDAQGRAEVPIALPDNLTRWRGIVQGFSLPPGPLHSNQVQTTLLTRLPLSVRTIVPRFAVEGDEFEARGLVNNQLPQAVTVATEIQSTPAESLQVEPQQTRVFSRRLQVGPYDNQPLQVTTQVKAQEEADAERQEVPILPFGAQHREHLGLLLQQSAEFTAEVPAEVRQARLEVRLSPSLMEVVSSSLDYLADYPYGCVEQTMSRFGPTLVAAQAAQKLGLPLHKPVDKMVQAGLQKLYGYQHSDGGWGWWTYDDTHPYMTGYVLSGLVLAQQAGYTVDPQVRNRAIQCSQRLLNENPDPEVKTYLSWALSQAGQTPPLADDPSLSLYAQALLLQAAVAQKQLDLAQTLASRLQGLASSQEVATAPLHLRGPASLGSLHWQARALQPHGFLDDDVEATCQVLRGLLALNPQDPRLPAGLSWIMQQRRGLGWKTTKDTAQVVYLLSQYLQSSQAQNTHPLPSPSQEGEISIDGQPQALEAQGEQLRVIPLQAGQSTRIQVRPAGNLSSASLTLRYVDPDHSGQLEARPGPEFRVLRRYYRGRQELFSPLKLKPQEEITVHLEVFCERPLEYVMIQDYRAAGMEPVSQTSTSDWAQREDRDDRSLFFFTSLSAGHHSLRYNQRAQTPGRYRVLPTLAELMYQPDSQVRGNSQDLEISNP